MIEKKTAFQILRTLYCTVYRKNSVRKEICKPGLPFYFYILYMHAETKTNIEMVIDRRVFNALSDDVDPSQD